MTAVAEKTRINAKDIINGIMWYTRKAEQSAKKGKLKNAAKELKTILAFLKKTKQEQSLAPIANEIELRIKELVREVDLGNLVEYRHFKDQLRFIQKQELILIKFLKRIEKRAA